MHVRWQRTLTIRVVGPRVREEGRDILLMEEMGTVAILREEGREGPYHHLDHIL